MSLLRPSSHRHLPTGIPPAPRGHWQLALARRTRRVSKTRQDRGAMRLGHQRCLGVYPQPPTRSMASFGLIFPLPRDCTYRAAVHALCCPPLNPNSLLAPSPPSSHPLDVHFLALTWLRRCPSSEGAMGGARWEAPRREKEETKPEGDNRSRGKSAHSRQGGSAKDWAWAEAGIPAVQSQQISLNRAQRCQERSGCSAAEL